MRPVFAFAVLCILGSGDRFSVSGSNSQAEIVNRLRYTHQLKDFPPTENDEPVQVSLSLTLKDVVLANQDTNELDLVLWPVYSWKDPRLEWSTMMHELMPNNSADVTIPADALWKPDVVAYDQTAPIKMIYPDINVKSNSDGVVFYVPSVKTTTQCDLKNVDSSEGAECKLTFGSWSYDGTEIDLNFGYGNEKMDLTSFFSGSKFEVIGNRAVRNVVQYTCCPEPYVDLTYFLTIRTKRQRGWFS